MASQKPLDPLPQREELECILAVGDLRVLLLCFFAVSVKRSNP